MELWIRSQDKMKLIKASGLSLSFWRADNKVDINIEYKDYSKTLGTYATKERALEILDEIQHILDQINDPNLTILPVLVYEMPEE